jgi:hypothetical protein
MMVSAVSLRASWIAIDPTPPDPPTIRSARWSRSTPRRTPDPLEHQFPGSQRCERQRGRFGETQRIWLASDDSFVDQVELGVRSLSANGSGVEDCVPGSEKQRVRSSLDDDPRSVITEDLGLALRVVTPPPLDVDRIDGHGPNLDEKVPPRRARPIDLDIDQRALVFDRKGFQIGDGAHCSPANP